MKKESISDSNQATNINRLANAFQHSTDAIVITNADGIIKVINPAFTKMYGYLPEEVLGKTNRVVRSSTTDKSVYEDMWFGILNDKQWKGEIFNRKKDGSEIPVYLSITPVFEDGKLSGYMGLTIDLSDKYKMGEELDLQRRFSESLLSTANSLILSLDEDGNILLFNEMCENLLGYKGSDVIGKNWFETFLPEQKQAEAIGIFQNLIETGNPLHNENDVLTKSGELRTILWSNTTLKNENGEVNGVLTIGQDITEFLMIKRKMGRSEQLAVLGQLAAGIAHEVGNPLTSISSIVQVLQRKNNSDEVEEKLDMIIGQTRRITQIIRDLVDFSRPTESEEEPTDVNKQINKAVKIVQIDGKSKNVNFRLNLSNEIGKPNLIADQFFQVILNLLLNSLDAMRDGKEEISITTEELEDSVVIRMSDNGTGIAPKNIDRIFEPFFSTKEVGKGTGLGLWVSNGIIQSFGGGISVESEEGEGSTFTIALPLQRTGK